MNTDITIFVLSYCRPHFLSEAVSSLLALNLKKNQIVILDNGSPHEMMASFRLQYGNLITWVGSSENKGVAWNLKRAFDLAESKYFMIFHDDDRLLLNSITSQMEILDRDPSLVGVSSNGYVIESDGVRAETLVLPNMPTKGVRYFKNSAQVATHVYSDSCIPFSPIIYKTAAAKTLSEYIELWYENFGPVMDVVLEMQLADIGPIVLNFEPLYECRRHATQDSSHIDESWNRALRDYCLSECRGAPAELDWLSKQIPSAYTFAFLYHLSKSIFALKFINALKIIKGIQPSCLSISGAIRFFKFGLLK